MLFFFQSLVCFVIISSLGFCKLLLQLGIFSFYFQDLLGSHQLSLVAPCSLPEYMLVLLGTLFMSSGSCFWWHFRYLLRLLMSLFSCYCSDTEVG